jgi:formylglycine-generating enzyme required for sulfatase activity
MIRKPRALLLLVTTVGLAFAFVQHSLANVFDMAPGLTNLQFVPIGNPGNPGDPQEYEGSIDLYGSVSYLFQIGRYEVTSAQYVEFLNAVAKTDTYGLYNADMWNDEFGCKIQRQGASGNYAYSVAPDRANQPVNFVSFWDSLRFTNWLHNGQPAGPQSVATTEQGAYAILGFNGLGGTSIVRRPGARYWLPSEDEWYKAAFYDPAAGHYWEYPTRSDIRPSNTLPDTGNNANYLITIFDVGNYYTVGSPYWRTDVGTFADSEGPYGTYDQGGNAFEWNEEVYNPNIPSFAFRGFRGSSWGNYGDGMMASVRYYPQVPTLEDYHSGFRVATLPEPSSLILLAGGVTLSSFFFRRPQLRKL